MFALHKIKCANLIFIYFVSIESNFINEHVTYTARRSIVSIMHIEFQQLCIGALIGPYWILYSKRCMQFVKKELENYYALIGVAGHALGGRHYFAGQYSIKKPFNFGVLNVSKIKHPLKFNFKSL